MKKYKKHLISIFLVLMMMLLALSTSYKIRGEFTVINGTENTLKLKITRYDSSNNDFFEEFILQSGQSIKLKTFDGINTFANHGLGIKSFIIYNENDLIIKEYGEIHHENIPEVNYYLEKTEKSISYYVFNITDELLK